MSLGSPSPAADWPHPARRVLVLGGIRSGKSVFAEALVTDSATARYIATAARDATDGEWSARISLHRQRRPEGWATEEIGDSPQRLAALLSEADPADVLLVDDLGGWLTASLGGARGEGWDAPESVTEPIDQLAAAVGGCPAARLLLVSPEVGLSVVPSSAAGRAFADAQGLLNQRVAEACDAVALVVAGRPIWVAGGPAGSVPRLAGVTGGARATLVTPVEPDDLISTTMAADLTTRGTITVPDESAATAASSRLAQLDLPGSGFGGLTEVVRFAAATQERADPVPWPDVRVLLLSGDHAGGVGAGDSPAASARRLAGARQGIGPLATLAAMAGTPVTAIPCPPAAAIETEDALGDPAVEVALATGRRLVDEAVDSGADLLVLASCGSGGAGAAAAVAARLGIGDFPVLLPRATTADGRVDDQAWMCWCVAVRDALHRVRDRDREPRTVLAALGGGDIAVATGVLLQAATRRTPVLIDGPVAMAGALVARDVAYAVPRWLLLCDPGGQPTVQAAASLMGLKPLFDLGLDLGEGAAALVALPMLRAALAVAAAVPPRAPADQPAEAAPVPAEPAEPPPVPAEQVPAEQPTGVPATDGG